MRICLFYRYPPFFDEKPFVIYEKILAGKIDWPKHMDTVARYYILLLFCLHLILGNVFTFS